MKNIFIIHRWGGKPNSDWYAWLKNELEVKGYNVSIPEMPNTEVPDIKEWVSKLNAICPTSNKDTIFIGHSIGCQAILRYLSQTSDDIKVDQLVLVAPWTKLKPIIKEEDGAEEIAKPWVETPIEWGKIKAKVNKSVAIFSIDDYYVYSEEANIFEEKLGSKILILQNRGHFTGEDGVISFPEIIDFL